MELYLLAGVVVAVAGVALINIKAFKPQQHRSPAPTEVKIPLNEAYKKLHDFMAKGRWRGNMWKVLDQRENAYVKAGLTFREAYANADMRVDVTLNIDLQEIDEQRTEITWSCQLKHWCDQQTATKLCASIEKMVAAIFEEEKSNKAMPVEVNVPTRQRLTKAPAELAFAALTRALTADILSGYRVMISAQKKNSCDLQFEKSGGDVPLKARLNIAFHHDDETCKFEWTWLSAEALTIADVDLAVQDVDRWLERTIDGIWRGN